ncbi:MAG: hypothetical protein L0Y62_04775, partial [Nitrospirae bacterium]|nr:hypothetical protein [Nitrospirota bacterium]
MRRYKRPLLTFGAVIIFLAASLFFLTRTTFLTMLLDKAFRYSSGYSIRANSIRLSPLLKGDISGLEIKGLKKGGLSLVISNIGIDHKIIRTLKGEIEDISLNGMDANIHISDKKKRDLAFLERMPAVRRLSIKNSSIKITSAFSPYVISLTNININAADFSFSKGGNAAITANYTVSSTGGEAVNGSGYLEADIKLSDPLSSLWADCHFRLHLDSLRYDSASVKNAFVLQGFQVQGNLKYSAKSGDIAAEHIKGAIGSIASFTARLDGNIKNGFSCKTMIETDINDMGNAFSLLKPIIPPSFRDWQLKGRGFLKAEADGRYDSGGMKLKGGMAIHFIKAGFMSPDGDKGGEGIDGHTNIEFRRSADRKTEFKGTSVIKGGEYLFGKYYNNLKGHQLSASYSGQISTRDPYLKIRGGFDLFGTGRFGFSS